MELTLTGYYGFGNFGDDVILLSLLVHLNTVESVSQVHVLVRDDTYSHQPEFQFPKVRYHATRRLPAKFAKYRHFVNTGLFLWGGGTCLYEPEDGDIRGMESFLHNVRLLRLLRRRYGFLGIGMGPLRSDRARAITRQILAGAAFVTYRDPASLEIARTLMDPNPNPRLEICGDPFLLFEKRLRGFAKPAAKPPRSRNAGAGTGSLRTIGFSGHFGLAQNERAAAFYADQLDRLIEDLGVEVRLIPMQRSREVDDNRFHARIAEKSRHRDRFRTLTWTRIESLVHLFEGIDLLIGMRLHSLLLADVLGIAAIGIAQQPKVSFYLDAFRDLVPRRSYRLLESIDPADVIEAADTARKERHLIDQTLTRLRSGAEKNIEVLRAMLD